MENIMITEQEFELFKENFINKLKNEERQQDESK